MTVKDFIDAHPELEITVTENNTKYEITDKESKLGVGRSYSKRHEFDDSDAEAILENLYEKLLRSIEAAAMGEES